MTRLVSGLRALKNPVPGLDVAGTVVAAGADATEFAVGEEVSGIGQGSFAEYARARQDKLAPKPASLTFGQAAVVAGLRADRPAGPDLPGAPGTRRHVPPPSRARPREARSHDDRRRVSPPRAPGWRAARDGLEAPSPPWLGPCSWPELLCGRWRNHDNVIRTQVRPLTEAAEHQARLLPPARYRHQGDVIRLHVETAG